MYGIIITSTFSLNIYTVLFQVIYIDPGQPVPDMSVTVAVVESREITHLSVPPLRNDLMTEIEGTLEINIK